MNEEPADAINARTAAKILGVSRQRLSKLVARRAVPFWRDSLSGNNDLRFSRAAVVAFARVKRPPGRPVIKAKVRP